MLAGTWAGAAPREPLLEVLHAPKPRITWLSPQGSPAQAHLGASMAAPFAVAGRGAPCVASTGVWVQKVAMPTRGPPCSRSRQQVWER